MSPETYWKRRVFVLAGLLVIVALIAYACTRPSSPDTEQAADTGPEEAPEDGSSPSVSPSQPPTDAPSSGDGEDKGDGDDEDSDGGKSGSDGSEGADESDESTGDGPAKPEKPSDPCRPKDVVVTMDVDKKNYAWDDKPKVELTVVNTGEQTCTVDVGPKEMEVRITSGDDRIFSTADCVGDKGHKKKKLKRGVPHTRDFTWDRKRSWKKCPDKNVDAKRPGTYVASLHGEYDKGVEDHVFRLK